MRPFIADIDVLSLKKIERKEARHQNQSMVLTVGKEHEHLIIMPMHFHSYKEGMRSEFLDFGMTGKKNELRRVDRRMISSRADASYVETNVNF